MSPRRIGGGGRPPRPPKYRSHIGLPACYPCGPLQVPADCARPGDSAVSTSASWEGRLGAVGCSVGLIAPPRPALTASLVRRLPAGPRNLDLVERRLTNTRITRGLTHLPGELHPPRSRTGSDCLPRTRGVVIGC